MDFWQSNKEVTPFIYLFFLPQTGVYHWTVCTWQDRYCPSGCGSEWDGDVKGELLILSEYPPDIYPFPDLCFLFYLSLPSAFFFFYALLFPFPRWESLPKCVSWVLTDAFYDSEECECVGIFKHASELQPSTIVILHSPPAKTNMAIVGMSLCSEFITGRVELASIVLMDLDPHSLPLDLEHSACGNTHVKPFVCLCLWTKSCS